MLFSDENKQRSVVSSNSTSDTQGFNLEKEQTLWLNRGMVKIEMIV